MIDVNLAMGFFWLGAGIIVLSGAVVVYSMEKGKRKRR